MKTPIVIERFVAERVDRCAHFPFDPSHAHLRDLSIRLKAAVADNGHRSIHRQMALDAAPPGPRDRRRFVVHDQVPHVLGALARATLPEIDIVAHAVSK
jgi:hypothetical protein